MSTSRLRFDQVGNWTEVKLEIVRKYAQAYSTILSKRPRLTHSYIEGFAGAGVHESRKTGLQIPGSPLNALSITPHFSEYHFIDLNEARVENLDKLIGSRDDVFLYHGDCNSILLEKVFPRIRYEEYRRGLCLLDPYGLTLDWAVVEAAGRVKSVEVFLNFPIMDMNRNALWRNPAGVDPSGLERMTSFWGDDSWRKVVYGTQGSLFGPDDLVKEGGNEEIVKAFRKRLQEVAGFKYVPEPIPMLNSKGATVYYLYFASQDPTGARIAREILSKHN